MRMIDEDLSREQFAGLDSETTAQLVAAVEHDFATWAMRLAEAASAGNAEGMRRARHALSGLCGAFGATALQQASDAPLLNRHEREALLATCQTTIAAIRDAAMAGPGA